MFDLCIPMWTVPQYCACLYFHLVPNFKLMSSLRPYIMTQCLLIIMSTFILIQYECFNIRLALNYRERRAHCENLEMRDMACITYTLFAW